MLSVSSKIWTSVAVSISYDDNHYSKKKKLMIMNAIVRKKKNTEETIGLMIRVFDNGPGDKGLIPGCVIK